MTEADLDQLVVLLRKLKAHLKAKGAPLALMGTIADVRKATTQARKLGLEESPQ